MAKKPTSNDPANWLKLPDAELGYLLLAQFAAEQARELGLPVSRMNAEYMERVRQQVLTLLADKASLAAVQVALHAVASGNPERAGQLYRQLLLDGATHLRYENFTIAELQRRRTARSKGGKAAAETRRQDPDCKKPKILKMAAGMERSREPRSGRYKAIAAAFDVSPGYVGRVLREAGYQSRYKKKKRTDT